MIMFHQWFHVFILNFINIPLSPCALTPPVSSQGGVMQFSPTIPLLHRMVLQQKFYALYLDNPNQKEWRVEYEGRQYVMVEEETGKIIREADNG